MLAKPRFWIYRNVVAFLIWISFRTQRVYPLEPPTDGTIRFRPYAEAFPDMPLPGLVTADTFPASERGASRLLRIKLTKAVLSLVRHIAPGQVPPVPADEEQFLRAVYPGFFRRAWPTAPHVPSGLLSDERGNPPDLVAELAVRGPFASYLRAAPDSGDYLIDVSWMLDYDTVDGVMRPGGTAELAYRDGALHTVAPAPGSQRAALLAAMNEDLTTFRHNISLHLALLTSFGVVTTNHLDAEHPVRRLLHPCFQTLLIGNREVAELQLPGRRGFSALIFSHDHTQLARMAADYLRRFDFWDFEPDTQFARRGTTETPFAYPYRDNVLRLWKEHLDYVTSYLSLYYRDDTALAGDQALVRWSVELDRLVPNGVRRPDGGPTLDWLTRLSATLIHVSTVEHDYLNNVAWNYSTLGWIVPTVVPLSGELMDQRRAFDLLATIIGTWKPYNMLLTADVPSLALDEPARRAMTRWIERLVLIQEEMASRPEEPWLSYPAKLNPSISD
jgi:Lipoxygenase